MAPQTGWIYRKESFLARYIFEYLAGMGGVSRKRSVTGGGHVSRGLLARQLQEYKSAAQASMDRNRYGRGILHI